MENQQEREIRQLEAEKNITIGKITSKKEALRLIEKNYLYISGVFSILTFFCLIAIVYYKNHHYLFILGLIFSLATLCLNYFGKNKKTKLLAILLGISSVADLLVFAGIEFIFQPYLPELYSYLGDEGGAGGLLIVIIASFWFAMQMVNAIFAWNKLPETEDPLAKEKLEEETKKNHSPLRQILNGILLIIAIIAAFIVFIWLGLKFFG